MQNVSARTMDTLSQIQSMLSKEYDLPMERLGPDQPLADLGIDSLTTIEFMFKLEDTFSIRLSEERGDLTTVNDIAVLVDTVLKRNATGA
jgi:acyl carrier protein